MPLECQNESGVCDDGLQPGCRLNRLNVMRHTRTCSVHFEGDPGRTKLDPASSIFALTQYLQRKSPKSRRAKAAQGSQRNTTQTSKNKMVFTSRKQTIRKPEPVCIVQSDLSEQGSGIVSLSVTNLAEIPILSPCSSQISMASSRASTLRNPGEIKIQKFFTTLIRNTDSPYL